MRNPFSAAPRLLWFALIVPLPTILHATVLPEDRADVMYHSYKGGDITVDGPAMLVRKQATSNTSVYYKYYVDHVSSASIDVKLIGASRYQEERTEHTAGVDYLHGKTLMGLAYTTSSENDYQAKSIHFNLSQDFFGDLTTFSMGYSKGKDTVSKNHDLFFVPQNIDRQNYRLGLSQIFTRNWIGAIGFETIADEGYLNNPYRTYRYCNAGCTGYLTATEKYPHTRTSNAISFRSDYFLPYRAALHGDLTLFEDSWGINAKTLELGYSQPAKKLVLDFRMRYYTQNKADFYRDLFDYADQFTYMAHHKELSTFDSFSTGITINYEFAKQGWWIFDKGAVNLSYDRTSFKYKDFRDATLPGYLPGTEPLYSFKANVLQLFVSLWF